MGLTEKAKELADTALRRVGEVSETAREKAPGFIDRAADVTVKAVDSAASGIDRATGGRYHDRLEGATAKVEESLDRARPAEPPTSTTPTGATTVEVVQETGPAPAPAAEKTEKLETDVEAPTTPAAGNQDETGPVTPPRPQE